MSLVIYTVRLTPRVEYIFSTLLQAIGCTDFRFITDAPAFVAAEGAKINYSAQPICHAACWIPPAALLFEEGITLQSITCFKTADYKAFFPTANGDLSFDVFAASFYLLSRYEEYLPHKKDMYGRFAHENSLAYTEGFLAQPLVNILAKELCRSSATKIPLVGVSNTFLSIFTHVRY